MVAEQYQNNRIVKCPDRATTEISFYLSIDLLSKQKRFN